MKGRFIEAARLGLSRAVVVGALALLAGCEEPQRRSFADFMEDQIAREGTLARCDADPEATSNDLECANARRASMAIALRRERERRAALERESELKLEAMRRQMAEAERIARESALAAAAAEREAYERLWREQTAAAFGGRAGVPGTEDALGAGDAPSSGPFDAAPTDRLDFIGVPPSLRAGPDAAGETPAAEASALETPAAETPAADIGPSLETAGSTAAVGDPSP